MPNFHQHVSCPTRGPNTLDHCYTPSRMPIKLVPYQPSGSQTTRAIFLTPEYNKGSFRNPRGRGKWRAGPPTLKAMLQASLDDVGLGHVPGEFSWRQRVHGCSIKLCQHANRPSHWTVTIRTFSNQKPWVDRTIGLAVNQRTAAYNAGLLSGNMSDYKASCYALRLAVRAAKLRYRERVSHIFSSMTLDACGRDWRPSVLWK